LPIVARIGPTSAWRLPAIDRRDAPAWTPIDWLAVLAVAVGAALIRLPGLARPTQLVFDEIFYARDACWYVTASPAVCEITELASRTHPPLGKWIIASGIALFGYEPFGWRIAAALAGVATVVLLYVLARRLFASVGTPAAATAGAFAASALLATDFLHAVQSRIAMLDVFIVLFVVGGMLAIVLDRDRVGSRAIPRWLSALTLHRPWRLVAGACLGAAAGTKWSGAYVALVVIGLVIAWELAGAMRRMPGVSRRASWWAAFRSEALPTLALLGVVPVLVYLAGYIGRMPGELIGAPWDPASVWRGIWEHQVQMFDFHVGLRGHHPYESPPWSWPLLKRPVAFYFTAGGGAYREILALGNPLVWWSGIVALGVLGVAWVRRGLDVRAPELVILAGAVATYGPWLALAASRDQVFLWYLLPTIPFLFLALGLLAARAWSMMLGRVATVLYAAIVAASFAFYFPLLTALPVTPGDWWLRIPFRDCARPGAPTLALPDDEINTGPPPNGWCWI
jgi:dolichyl-phosphate-mannose--protein O-mannosyl transferase